MKPKGEMRNGRLVFFMTDEAGNQVGPEYDSWEEIWAVAQGGASTATSARKTSKPKKVQQAAREVTRPPANEFQRYLAEDLGGVNYAAAVFIDGLVQSDEHIVFLRADSDQSARRQVKDAYANYIAACQRGGADFAYMFKTKDNIDWRRVEEHVGLVQVLATIRISPDETEQELASRFRAQLKRPEAQPYRCDDHERRYPGSRERLRLRAARGAHDGLENLAPRIYPHTTPRWKQVQAGRPHAYHGAGCSYQPLHNTWFGGEDLLVVLESGELIPVVFANQKLKDEADAGRIEKLRASGALRVTGFSTIVAHESDSYVSDADDYFWSDVWEYRLKPDGMQLIVLSYRQHGGTGSFSETTFFLLRDGVLLGTARRGGYWKGSQEEEDLVLGMIRQGDLSLKHAGDLSTAQSFLRTGTRFERYNPRRRSRKRSRR